MLKTALIDVDKLKLDLINYRTVPQNNEEDAINAMIAIKPDRFFAVMDSIAEDGYLLTENLIVIQDNSTYTVKEGNRRVASLKLIHGEFDKEDFGIPEALKSKIDILDSNWKESNKKIPCSIFSPSEADLVDKIVNLTHAKGEKASRDPWTSVAKARHNRDQKNASEPALDLLEKYLKVGKNLTEQQKERWSGDYPLTVLDEALRKIITRIGYKSISNLVKQYSKNKFKSQLEQILLKIGLNSIQFKNIRDKNSDFAKPYGIPEIKPPTPDTDSDKSNSTTSTTGGSNSKTNGTSFKAVALGDPKNVSSILKKFYPKGANRQKVVTLKDEIMKLKIKDTPIAFCFILRSMFEISAKAYCKDHRINLKKSGGKDKSLVEILRGVTKHLTSNNTNREFLKVLHGAMTELGRPEGILSVTSMNQLVHNPNFSVTTKDVSILFGNIYPLLEAMN